MRGGGGVPSSDWSSTDELSSMVIATMGGRRKSHKTQGRKRGETDIHIFRFKIGLKLAALN